MLFCGRLQGTYRAKLHCEARAYRDICITLSLANPEGLPKHAAGLNTRTTTTDTRTVNSPAQHEKKVRLPQFGVRRHCSCTTHRTQSPTRVTRNASGTVNSHCFASGPRAPDAPLTPPWTSFASSAALHLCSPPLECRFAIVGLMMATGRCTVGCCCRCPEPSRQQLREVRMQCHDDLKAPLRDDVLLRHDGVKRQNYCRRRIKQGVTVVVSHCHRNALTL
jgi:hypothetical protein